MDDPGRLDMEELTIILLDMQRGDPPRIVGPEADKARVEFTRGMELCKKNGWVMDIPGDWEVGEENE